MAINKPHITVSKPRITEERLDEISKKRRVLEEFIDQINTLQDKLYEIEMAFDVKFDTLPSYTGEYEVVINVATEVHKKLKDWLKGVSLEVGSQPIDCKELGCVLCLLYEAITYKQRYYITDRAVNGYDGEGDK